MWKSLWIIGLFILVVILAGCVQRTQEDCDKIQSSDSRDRCYIELAKQEQNISICDNLKSEKGFLKCYDWYYGVKGGTENSLSICDRIELTGPAPVRYKVGCINTVAFNLRDPSICQAITEFENESYSPDTGLPEGFLDECYLVLSNSADDPEFCLLLPYSAYRDECNLRLGITNQDKNICSQIEGDKTREKCMLTIAIALHDRDLCKNFEFYKDDCLAALDPSLCENKESEERDNCYNNAAVLRRDMAYCYKIQSPFTNDMCLNEYFQDDGIFGVSHLR